MWSIFTCFQNFGGFANIRLHIPVKMANKVKKGFDSTVFNLNFFSLNLKNITLYFPRGWIFLFQMVVFTTLFRHCPMLWKSKLKIMTTLFRRCLTFFKSTLKQITLSRRCSTLIWCCATSRRHINLKKTLKHCWNVCWGGFILKYKWRRWCSVENMEKQVHQWKFPGNRGVGERSKQVR